MAKSYIYTSWFLSGALGDEEKKEEGAEATEEGEDPEIAEARREAEEKRKEKHRQMEAEREELRQSIRDKVSQNSTQVRTREIVGGNYTVSIGKFAWVCPLRGWKKRT